MYVLFRNLTIVDIMSVFFGNWQPLQRIRAPLQTFVRETFLQGQDATDANLNAATNRVLEDMQEIVDTSFVCSRTIMFMGCRKNIEIILLCSK